jgi:hypothetical protein
VTRSPQSRWRWTRLQYRLSTLLIVVALVAGVCAWLVRPKAQTLMLQGGLTVRQRYRESGDRHAIIRSGSWLLSDREGVTRIAGHFYANEPDGRWTVYYEDGRRAVEGRCRHGWKVGPWRAWWPDGTLRAEWQYEPRESADAEGPSRGAKRFVRSGPVRVWWPNGQLRCAGRYRQDAEDGDWKFRDESGREVASGPFREGVRHGRWTFADDSAPDGRSVVFAHGAPVNEAALPAAAEKLRRGTLAEKLAAADALERAGAAAVDLLAQAVASRDATTRRLAARALACMGEDAGAAAAVLKTMRDDSDQRVRRYARLALLLIDPVHRDDHFGAAIETLAGAAPRDEFETLLHIFQRSPPHQRSVFPRLLEIVGMEAAGADQPPRPAEMAERLHDRLDMLPDRLAESLSDAQVSVRRGAVELLAELWGLCESGDPVAHDLRVATLLQQAAQDTEPGIRERAEQLLGRGATGGMGGIF